ncbi:MAG TPA: sulfur carrier protein ThiS [Acidimicrobiales bacterium]|nr:sulfur carrier protein ThiS [Acidimicrobiales bacterium]
MEVFANGDSVTLAAGATITDLLTALGLGAKWVVAELNGRAVERSQMPNTALSEGDKVELVRAVAGG